MSRATVATIHLGALRHNLARLKVLAAPAQVMAVVKADAYGHGLERVARALDSEADAFAVAALGDGLRLRAAGHRQRIVVLSGPDSASDIAEMQRLQLDAAIHHDAQLQWLAGADAARGRLRVWLKVDSGMHRLGFAPARVAEVHAQLASMTGVDPEIGLLTHFSDSEVFGGVQTAAQVACFNQATQMFAGPRSLSNSAAVLGWPEARGDWVRTGGLLYGLSVVEGSSGEDFGFRPAMTLSTRLIAINAVGKGERIGYNGTWTCPEDMPIGVAAVGYGDGYPRSAAAGTPVLVGDRRVPLIGRVSMDLITLDLRTAPEAKIGDRVVLWGPELPVEIIAAQSATISYDLTCGMTRRVLFVEDEH
ncbi:alanine racemase [Rhodanobacter sp. FDAARGOS 1247]|uniref:alanine racemase n=1 Tax=Rhodanobacter sp. FDAARGOS 1247 TaxID=2778082 RepID=UPI0019506C92|nr:alanine racemase [Rhodanobacter sp. FDAARGOS 1247]QRP64980.1 alanine racemase [Rhodanobacter sp. FDAARGOS 1247]